MINRTARGIACGTLWLADHTHAKAARIRMPAPERQRLVGILPDRGRSVLELDLRSAAGKEQCLKLTDNADVLIAGFRTGVMARLGLGPAVLCERNSRLIYGRMTGWGQDGPLARSAGHDFNYFPLTGSLAVFRISSGPLPPPLPPTVISFF